MHENGPEPLPISSGNGLTAGSNQQLMDNASDSTHVPRHPISLARRAQARFLRSFHRTGEPTVGPFRPDPTDAFGRFGF